MKKSEIIDLMCKLDEQQAAADSQQNETADEQPKAQAPKKGRTKAAGDQDKGEKNEAPAKKKRIVVTTAGKSAGSDQTEASSPKAENARPAAVKTEPAKKDKLVNKVNAPLFADTVLIWCPKSFINEAIFKGLYFD